jgi:uncharacterized protein YndB with AHSA1/START domain
MNIPEEAKNRTLTIEKLIDAPVSLVWEAWSNPEHVLGWWDPPGMTLTIVEHNFTQGGNWKYTTPMPDGKEFISEGTYLEIIPFKKIVTTMDLKPMTEGSVIHILFEEIGEQTQFTFSAVYPTEAYAKQQEAMGFYNGWGGALARMEAWARK